MGESDQVTSLSDEVSSGDRRRGLEAMRDRLAAELEREAQTGYCVACKRSSSAVAPLAKQLADLLAQLDRMPVPEEESVVDDLAAKRTERRAAASGS